MYLRAELYSPLPISHDFIEHNREMNRSSHNGQGVISFLEDESRSACVSGANVDLNATRAEAQ